MPSLAQEVQIWNTPLIGSYLLWCFTKGYTFNHESGESPIVLLHFIASAILSERDLIERISDKRPDLHSYIKSFSEKKDIDRLLMIHSRAISKKRYTLDSIDLAVSQGLIVWNVDDACLYPKQLSVKPKKGSGLKPAIKKAGKQAEILGKWFSKLEVSEIARLLKVVL